MSSTYQKAQSAVGVTTVTDVVVVGGEVVTTVVTLVGTHPDRIEHSAPSPAYVHTWQLTVVTDSAVEMLVVAGSLV